MKSNDPHKVTETDLNHSGSRKDKDILEGEKTRNTISIAGQQMAINAEAAVWKAKYDRVKLLYEASTSLHATLDPMEALQRIVAEMVRLVGATSGSVVLVNPNTGFLEIQASIGLPKGAPQLRLKVGEGVTGWVAKNGVPVLVTDTINDPRYIMLRENVRSELAVPLEVNGEVRGVLNVDSEAAGVFDLEDQRLLEDLAPHVTSVIENTWRYEQLRLKARLFESLISVAFTINSHLGLDETLQVITREAARLMDARMASLLLKDESGEWLEMRASHGATQDYLRKPRLNIAESLVGIVMRRKKPMRVENVQRSSHYQNVSLARKEGLVSLLSVPLVHGEEAIGALNVYKGEPHTFSNEEIKILTALSQLSAVAIEKAQLYERIVDMEETLRMNEKLSALGLLAAEVAHEIRNPLTVMKMLFHSLELRFDESDPRSRDMEIMEEKMNLLNRIVEQVLDFARSTEPVFVWTNLNKLIEDLGILIRHKLRQQNIRQELNLASDLPGVLADETQLKQAFLNLILNAVEAMPGGGVLSIQTRLKVKQAEDDCESVELIFTDTGQGMTEEQRRRLFASLLNTTKPRGTGLGLAIVKRVVETHHGKVKIRSSPNEGASFIVTLPLDAGTSTQPARS